MPALQLTISTQKMQCNAINAYCCIFLGMNENKAWEELEEVCQSLVRISSIEAIILTIKLL